jgi:phospholipid/cholesterol/gamma-HCH transport system substrate-binding protein
VSKEFKIGLLTIVAGALLYYGFNFLRGTNLFSPAETYYITYPNVTGLNVSNPVYFNGLPVGRVSGFILEQNKNRIVVSLDIDESVIVGEDATATLANDGLLGGKAILLDVGKSDVRLEPGDTLNSEIAGDLLSQFEPVADNLNSTITKINTVLDQMSATDLKGLVDTLKYSIGSITRKVNRIDIQPLVDNLDSVTLSFSDRSKQLDTLLQSSNVLMDSLKAIEYNALVLNLNRTLEGINELMMNVQSENGTIGKLMANDSVYNSLNKLLVDLDELAIHFNNYPKDFMKPLGRKNKKLKGVSLEGN